MGLFDRLKGEGQEEKPAAADSAALVTDRRAELETALRAAEAAGDAELIELVQVEMRELEARAESEGDS